MGFLGIGDTNRMLVDIPVQYAQMVGLPYDPDDPKVYAASGKKINIKVSRGKGDLHAEGVAVERLMEYGIPAQAAKNLLGVGSKKKNYETLDDSDDPRYELLQLEELSPEEVTEGRGRTGMLRGIDVAAGAEYGQRKPISPFWDLDATPFESQTVTGERVAEGAASDPFGTTERARDIARFGETTGVYGESLEDALAAMRGEEAEFEEVRRKAQEHKAVQDAQDAMRAAQVKKDVEARAAEEAAAAREAELRARAEEVRLDPGFAAEEGLGWEGKGIDPVT